MEHTLTFATGNKYIGKVVNGAAQGKGIMTYANGNAYMWEWNNNQRHGKGALTYVDGRKYVGEFKNSYLNGLGKYWNSDKGYMYSGSFKNGACNGLGEIRELTSENYCITVSGTWERLLRKSRKPSTRS